MSYLKPYEFDSPDLPGSGNYMNRRFIQKLEAARVEAGVPFIINSGARSEKHNKKVGGKPDSTHLLPNDYKESEEEDLPNAADIACSNSRHRFLILAALIKVGFNRIGIADTFIHVDDDASKDPQVIWTY